MKRRDFLSAAGTSAAALGLAGCQEAPPPVARANAEDPAPATAARDKPEVKLYAGTQRGPTSKKMLQFIKRHGVDHVCGFPPNPGKRGFWTVEDLEKTRETCEAEGVTLDMVALPFLTSSHIDREKRGAIMLGKSPERDRDIEDINKMTVACAKAGIPAWKYNMSLLGVLRVERTPGRGGSTYSTWKASEAEANPPLTRAGRVTEDMALERMAYFVERVIPVCEEYKIRAACHLHDPGTPPGGFQGIDRLLGNFEGVKKFIALSESRYHGLNLCLGSMMENLEKPNEQIHDVIRYFGEKKRIFNIHFRNIIGKRGDFREVYLDNGEIDMLQVMRSLVSVGYEYMVMPDHVPRHNDDPGGLQGFAHSYGFIQALIHAIKTSG
ncbi:MAG: D-mannonate dehydratase [Planctomycetaceae bacterium]|jgi:mannonate dehydratase|nr:D-mannonate dehydratase [Planctomycetaceae bacterium]